MNARKPAAEIAIRGELVRRLLTEQHPDLADQPLTRVDEGWDNVIYRIGSMWAARLPRRAEAVPLLLHEQRWLPGLASRLDVDVPRVERVGRPGTLFPWPWSVVRWVEGGTANVAPLGRGQGDRLGGVLRDLHRPAPPDAPRNRFRGVPLRERANPLDEPGTGWGPLEPDALRRLRTFWTRGIAAPEAAERVWIHGDLHPKNVLVRGRQLAGIIDWGDLTAGDRATDLAAAWTLLRSDEERRGFWDRYGWTEARWLRARAWAVVFGVTLSTSGDPRHQTMGRAVLGELLTSRE